LQFEKATDKELENLKVNYISNLENKFRLLTPKIVDYKTSKTDKNISTIRHGFNLLKRVKELEYIRKKIINEKSFSNLDNDFFAEDFDVFLTSIEPETIIEKIHSSFNNLNPSSDYLEEVNQIINALEIFDYSFDECVKGLEYFVKKAKKESEFENILSKIRLYNIEKPFVALASDYGVPQNRERVLFIGCRKDQKLISEVPATVSQSEKVNVFEAIYDLDFIGNDEERFNYEKINLKAKFNGSTEKMTSLIHKRNIDGKPNLTDGLTYSEWSKKGRLNGRFKNMKNPFYVRNFEELENTLTHLVAPLQNHKTSKQNPNVINRLNVILNSGNYENAKSNLKEIGLESDKRSYTVLKPESQSSTIMTIADDYIHYSNPRPLTVREMARLQSFDDSFVFQGKLNQDLLPMWNAGFSQKEIVINGTPPLFAKAIGQIILKSIQ